MKRDREEEEEGEEILEQASDLRYDSLFTRFNCVEKEFKELKAAYLTLSDELRKVRQVQKI